MESPVVCHLDCLAICVSEMIILPVSMSYKCRVSYVEASKYRLSIGVFKKTDSCQNTNYEVLTNTINWLAGL